MKVKEESEKVGLKLNIQKTKIMASGPITSWQIHGKHSMGNSGNSVRLYFGGLQITADGDCSHEIKRHLLLGRKVMTNIDSILKSRDITLSTKVRLVKALVFPVVIGSSVHGISQAIVLGWIAIFFSRGSSQPRDWTRVSHIVDRCFTVWATREATHVRMWELDYKEIWAPKNWCFWTVVLEKTLESPLDCKEIKSVHPKADQSWLFIGRTDV